MSYTRITIRRDNKNHVPDTHDYIYGELDGFLSEVIGLGKETHVGAVDTKFFVDEIADNFLLYDDVFNKVTIDLWLDQEMHMEMKIVHDGNDFDPLDAASDCPKIKAAIHRLNITPQEITLGERETTRFWIKYSLRRQ